MGSKPKSIKAPNQDLEKDANNYINAISGVMPRLVDQEGKFRPEFQGLNLGDMQAFLQGTGGQQGLFGLGRAAIEESAGQLTNARAAELAAMTGQTGAVRGLFGALSPESATQVSRASQEADRAAAAAAQGLTPEQRRMSDQQSREAFGSRGMLNSNSSVASEILNREGARAGLRDESARRGMDAFNMGQSFYTSPGLSMLGSAPLSYGAGQDQLGLGIGAIGAGKPQLIDIGAGFNLGAAQRQNVLNAQMANAQSKATAKAGMMGMVGQGIGAAASIAAI